MLRRLELARDARAPAVARQAVDDLRDEFDAGLVDDLRLLLSELVTNSVQHGGGDQVTVLIDPNPGGTVRCEVVDDGSGFVPRGRAGRDVGGWGLDLVEQLADRWGVREGSTHVWFELSADRNRV
jgi:anti-sigma regulatory factor (Ser/Thr protein kinase)